jgi:hypothetical protein
VVGARRSHPDLQAAREVDKKPRQVCRVQRGSKTPVEGKCWMLKDSMHANTQAKTKTVAETLKEESRYLCTVSPQRVTLRRLSHPILVTVILHQGAHLNHPGLAQMN